MLRRGNGPKRSHGTRCRAANILRERTSGILSVTRRRGKGQRCWRGRRRSTASGGDLRLKVRGLRSRV
jgi:hypothetical protein